MREFIANRLNAMRSTDEKAILKEAMNDIFLPLYDETERKYAALEQRIRDELPLVYDQYAVYSTVLPQEQFDRRHSYLSPVCPEDAEEPGLDTDELAAALKANEQPIIETVFCEADYLTCRRIEREKQILDGVFIVNSERYPFKCRLKPAKKYMEQTQTLYTAFLRNNVPWATINSTYLNKFFDLCLTGPANIPLGAKIPSGQIKISLGPYEKIMRQGLIPVWNIDKYRVKSDDFPVPVLDSVNYEHRFDLDSLGKRNGYLVDFENTYILDSRREDKFMVVTSPKNEGLQWDMYRLRHRQDSDVDIYPYPVLSNARKDSFSTRIMIKYGTQIGTKAEMRKLLTSFEVSEYVILQDFHIAGEKVAGDSYDMNPFIHDEVRDPAYQKSLVLAFKARERDLFINRDLISFLVSGLQAVYPEYRCVGVLV